MTVVKSHLVKFHRKYFCEPFSIIAMSHASHATSMRLEHKVQSLYTHMNI